MKTNLLLKIVDTVQEHSVLGVIGIIGGTAVSMLGGWDAGLKALIVFMAIDYISGLIVAGVFKASTKTATGALQSRAGWKGLMHKGMMLLIVLVATRLDIVIGADFVRDAVVIAYLANELISIVENMGLMGVYIPQPIVKAIDILKSKAEEKEREEKL